MKIFRRLYDRMMDWSRHRHAPFYLFAVAFAQSSFFPIPVDAMLVPMALANRQRAIMLGLIATIGSVLGAIAGYMIGAFLYESIGQPLLEFYGKKDAYDHFQTLYQQYGAWIVAAGGLTPIPFKVVTIASGALHLNLLTFVASAFAARGLRFVGEGILVWLLGDTISRFIDRYFMWVMSATFLLVVGGFILLGLLV